MMLDQSFLTRALPPGSMRYYAWLYCPDAHREPLAAVFVIESELNDTARASHDVAHIRLQWWREEIDNLIAGQARHPATQVLQHHSRNSDFNSLHAVLLSSAQELARTTFETEAELSRYLHGGLGGLMAMGAHCFTEHPSPQLIDAATRLGAFIRQAEILRDLRQDLHHGRLFIPLDELDTLNIEYESLQSSEWPPEFIALIQSRCTQQLMALNTLKQGLLTVEKQALRPLLVLAELHAGLIRMISLDPTRYTRVPLELSPLRKLWLAWRTARKLG